jgi:hypothetical protein
LERWSTVAAIRSKQASTVTSRFVQITKSLSSWRQEYVSGAADRAAAALKIASLFLRPRTFEAGRAA